MRKQTESRVELIAVERINVINPRVRNKKIFKDIISNIAELGLKRPITITRRGEGDSSRYDLVCGQGRLEAYQALGQQEIPAIVVDANTEDCLVMSLVENLARRQHRSIDQRIIVSSAFAATCGAKRDRLVSLGRYALRGVARSQELFTLDPGPITKA